MAIPLFRSNYRLDRLISHAKVGEMGGVPDYGDYTVRQRVDATDPGELILDWYAYNFTTGETSNYLTMEKDEAILAYTKPNGGWPVAGVIPLGQKIQIKNVNTSIVAFFHNRGPYNPPTFKADGNVEWTGAARTSQTVWEVAVRLADDVGKLEHDYLDSSNVRIGNVLGINVSISGAQTEVWAQRMEKNVIPVDAPEGLEAREILFQEEIQWITRTPVPASSVVFDAGLRYGIKEVEALNRGRYYLITGVRRYRELSVV